MQRLGCQFWSKVLTSQGQLRLWPAQASEMGLMYIFKQMNQILGCDRLPSQAGKMALSGLVGLVAETKF